MEIITSKEHRDMRLKELKKLKKTIEDGETKCIPQIYQWCLNNIKCLENMKF